jgi:hypothetical protein
LLSQKILAEISRLDGAMAAEHGLGRSKRKAISSLLDPQIGHLREQLKPFFDHEGILA